METVLTRLKKIRLGLCRLKPVAIDIHPIISDLSIEMGFNPFKKSAFSSTG